MGLLNNTVSICQFRVVGDPPAGDLSAWAGEKLAAKGFQSIEQTAEELSVGWVQLDDTRVQRRAQKSSRLFLERAPEKSKGRR